MKESKHLCFFFGFLRNSLLVVISWFKFPDWITDQIRLGLIPDCHLAIITKYNSPGPTSQGPHLRTPELRVTPGSTPRIYYITEGVNP
jgi:hypothetical protein